MTLVCGQYMPYLVEGECPNCGLKLAIHDYCIRLKCPVCEVTIEV
jgi:ribosomal protein S27AE